MPETFLVKSWQSSHELIVIKIIWMFKNVFFYTFDKKGLCAPCGQIKINFDKNPPEKPLLYPL